MKNVAKSIYKIIGNGVAIMALITVVFKTLQFIATELKTLYPDIDAEETKQEKVNEELA